MARSLKKIATICFTLITLCIYTPNLHANTLDVGVGMLMDGSPYKDHGGTYYPYPLLDIKTDHIYAKGFSAGVFLWKDMLQVHELSLGVNFGLTHFDNNNTDNDQLKQLDDRGHSLNGYLRYMYHTETGSAGIRIGHDFFNDIDGVEMEFWYELPVYIGPLILLPTAGIRLETEGRLQYYYGISNAEAARSGLPTYDPAMGITPYIGLNATLMLMQKINLYGGLTARYLSSEIRNSPMIEDSTQWTLTFGAMYNF